jgi:hypothetical protein
MGAQNRTMSNGRDLQAYLKAWCTAAKGNTAEAINALSLIGHPTVSGMASAVREDLANILVQNGDANAAEKLLMKAKIDDIEIFDLLAASYFEVGKTADAHEINERAIDRQLRSSEAARCHRFARRVILAYPGSRGFYMKELEELGNVRKRTALNLATDPDCQLLDEQIQCWISPTDGCVRYFESQGVDANAYQGMVSVYSTWPADTASAWTWLHIVQNARYAMPAPGADRLAVAALLAAFNSVRCLDAKTLHQVRMTVFEMRRGKHDAVLEPVLEQLERATDGYGDDPMDPMTQKPHPEPHCHALALHVD